MLEPRHAVRRITPLSLPETAATPDRRAGIAIRALPAAARFSLRLDPATAKSVRATAGFALDIPLNSHSSSGERSAARLGPNEWLLIGPDREAETIVREIEADLDGHFHALVDIGHRNAAIEISGVHAADVLNSGCPLDLSDSMFPAGSATRTLMGKAEIVLMRIDDFPVYQVQCWRSFASYVHGFLLEAAHEFDPAITQKGKL